MELHVGPRKHTGRKERETDVVSHRVINAQDKGPNAVSHPTWLRLTPEPAGAFWAGGKSPGTKPDALWGRGQEQGPASLQQPAG